MDGGEPDIPIYKVIECMGPTNTRIYTVAVYFRGKRLASSTGHSIQQAEMQAAKTALENSSQLFPQLDYQKRVIAQSIQRQRGGDIDDLDNPLTNKFKLSSNVLLDDDSNLPKQYRIREDISSDELDVSSPSDSDEDCKNIQLEERSNLSKKSNENDFSEEETMIDVKNIVENEENDKIENIEYTKRFNEMEYISEESLSEASLESGEIA